MFEMDAILVLNFGGQYCHLIARRIRDSGVYSEIVPNDMTIDGINDMKDRLNIKGIILSGGPLSIYEKDSPQMDKGIIRSGIPILGICYGHQLLAHYLNGKVVKAEKQEYGYSHAVIKSAKGIFSGLSKTEEVWMSHGDTVVSMPADSEIAASTENCPVAAFASKGMKVFGVQWHPEVVHTKNGKLLLDNFIFGVCGAVQGWNPDKDVSEYTDMISGKVGKGNALIALSGGVDSSTAALLSSKSLGKRLTAVFIDTGLMRNNESEQVKNIAAKLGINLLCIDAGKNFLKALKGVSDPEEKRKVIGREFIREFEKVARDVNADYLIQGTIYPDRIESGSIGKSSVIKTHHNVGGLPSDIKFKGVIEPLRDLYKDEVKKLALKLGMPKNMVYRQPFPGPGLAVRIIGSIDPEKIRILRRADAIIAYEAESSGFSDKLWQYFAVLTDIKSTGVKGDARTYGSVVAIRMVESTDAMTANFAKPPYELLERISTRLTGEIPEVTRVVYDVTHKPPSTIEWE